MDLNKPINELDQDLLNNLLYGKDGDETIPIAYNFSYGTKVTYNQKFGGLIPTFRHQYENTTSHVIRKNLEAFMDGHVCNTCYGGRLKPENLRVLVAGKNIDEFVKYDINEASDFFKSIHKNLTERQLIIANLIIKEIASRLGFLTNVGLSYLTLNRSIRSLSGGESQRIRLASQIGSQLTGIMYVLDEPSIGLHQHDNQKLINSLKKLKDLDNTVIVVEHDKATMEAADFLVDIGPGAGIHGGEILFSLPPNEIKNLNKNSIKNSLTAQYLLNQKRIERTSERRTGNNKSLILEGASGNNLKNINLKIPLGTFTCITGMSGSGKSSLINDTLWPILARHFYRSSVVPLKYKSIIGLENIGKVIEIDQSPIGRTPRSNPATYSGIFTLIRDFFALLPESKMRGYKSGRFSFNIPGGRCETCEGAGIKKIEMSFLPEVYVKCDECDGKRYNRETLTIKYKNKSISEVLEMTAEEALEFFKDIPRLKTRIGTLCDVGLTYITLGQQAPTLSGGEAQRVKLATELAKTGTKETLYLLDEPTTGLHFEDISILLVLLNKLVDKGHTVVVIEHNLDVIKYADLVIDLGPEGGSLGGEIIAEGTPEEISKVKKSYTGKYLKKELK